MKRNFLRYLMFGVALLLNIGVLAQNYTITPMWTTSTNKVTDGNGATLVGHRMRQPAMDVDGSLYILGGNYTNVNSTSDPLQQVKGVLFIPGDGSAARLISSGMYSAGFASCFDETGSDGTKGSVFVYHAINHTYVGNANSGAYAETYDRAPTALTIKRPYLGTGANGGNLNGLFGDNSASKYFNLVGDYSVGFPVEYIEVTGGVHSGGHVWFVPRTTTTDELEITAISVASFALNGKKVIKTGIKDLNASGSETSENRIDFYDTSSATAYRALLELQNNGHYDITINVNTGTVTSCKRIPDSNSNYLSTGAKIFVFDGHKFFARATRSGNSSYSTEFEILNIDDIEKPVVVAKINPTYGTPAASNSSVHIGTYINTLKVSNSRIDIIAYSPGLGATRYAMMTPSGSLPVSAIVQRDATKTLNQNVVLKWNTVTGATSYKIEYQRCYLSLDGAVTYRKSDGSGNTDESTWYVLSESTTATTATHSNRACVKVNNAYHNSFYRYRITASNGVVMYAQANLELLPLTIDWENQEIQNYRGYQKVQLFWKNITSNGGSTPSYFDIYRDGMKINSAPVQVYNYIDNGIPAGEHTYKVVGRYMGFNTDLETNQITSTTIVEPRDWRKTTYSIEEIYNYPIGKNSGEVWASADNATEFDNLLYSKGVRYKQGVYYKGNWYVAQQCDNNATSSEAYGGVIRFSADKSGILNNANNKRIIKYDNMSATWSATGGQGGTGYSAGLAMDEGGNIFVRTSGYTQSTGASSRKSFVFELGYGCIYLRDANGTYSTKIDVDLHNMQIHDNYGPIVSGGLYYGRVDYYCMSGDLSKVGGTAYLYVSSHLSKRSNRILLTRTGNNTITATLDRKIDVVLTNTETGEAFNTGDENYVFPVKYLKKTNVGTDANPVYQYNEAYRNAYIHNLRSNGYFYMDPGVRQKAIFETRSRINNAGGCTIGFNDEIFLITPQNVYSKNTGHFIVNMANRVAIDANGDETTLDVEEADLTEPIPVAQFTQDDMSSEVYTDVNGNWLYAVHGTIEGEKDVYGTLTRDNHDCVYIYQYVPGYRFAKYRLIPNNYFPPAPVTINIETRYDKNADESENLDILGFDGIVTWTTPDLYETSGGNKSYDYVSYDYVLTDVAGNIIDKRTITRAEAEAMNYTINYPWEGTTTYNGNPVILTPNEDESPKNYIAYIAVNYENLTDVTDKHQSEQTVDEDKAGYEGVGATGAVTVVPSAPINAGTDGDGNKYLQSLDRVDINIDAPDFNKAGKEEEPVSHYEIWIDKDGDNVFETQLTDFNLMQGGEGVYSEVHDGKIPGDYDFNNENYAIAGGKDEANNQANGGAEIVASPTTLFFNVVGTPYMEGTTPPTKIVDPAKWKYQVVTVYASTTQGDTNRDISQSYSSGMSTSTASVITGVEVVMIGSKLKVYPIPTKAQLNIESPEVLESVKIYNITGVLVQDNAFNGETIVTVDVENLAPGYYFVVVNNQAPVKIIKQ